MKLKTMRDETLHEREKCKTEEGKRPDEEYLKKYPRTKNKRQKSAERKTIYLETLETIMEPYGSYGL